MTPEEETAAVRGNLGYLYRSAARNAMGQDLSDSFQDACETFVKALRTWRPGLVNVRSWAWPMLRNRAIRRLRDAKRHAPAAESMDFEESSLHDTSAISPEMQVQNKELVGLLDRLSKKEQRVVRQRFYQDRTYREIGALMDLSHENVRQIEFHALTRLRTWLEKT